MNTPDDEILAEVEKALNEAEEQPDKKSRPFATFIFLLTLGVVAFYLFVRILY